MCEWVLAVVNFYDINVEINKKKEFVKLMKKDLKDAELAVANKRKELEEIIEKVTDLEK